MRWADNDLPVLNGSGDLVCATHFRKTDAANDKHNDARNILDCGLRFILVPVAIPCTENEKKKTRRKLEKSQIGVRSNGRWLYLVGAWYPPPLWARPAKNGKCLASNFSSMQSSMMSFMTGVQRDIWYVCSVMRSLRGTVYCFLRLPCAKKLTKWEWMKMRIDMIGNGDECGYIRRLYNWHPGNSNF